MSRRASQGSPRLADPDVEEVVRDLKDRVRELERAQRPLVIGNVDLEDGVPKAIAHGLGRAPTFAGPSAVRGGTATVEEVRDTHDRKKYVVLKATGADVTVDLVVL